MTRLVKTDDIDRVEGELRRINARVRIHLDTVRFAERQIDKLRGQCWHPEQHRITGLRCGICGAAIQEKEQDRDEQANDQ